MILLLLALVSIKGFGVPAKWSFVFVGLWFLMNTVIGFSRREYFSSREYNEETFACPYRLAKYMSGRRFELILSHLRFTKEKPPSFVDRFWEVREML